MIILECFRYIIERYDSDVLKKIITEIKTQFSTTIHVLCTDNALEYAKKDSCFCASHVILYHTTCPHTSQ